MIEHDSLSHFRRPLAIILKMAALKQSSEPLWKFNGPDAHFPYNLTPQGRQTFGVTDRRITRERLMSFRDALPRAGANQWLRPLAGALHRGDISVDQFRSQARDAIKRIYIGQYALAKGGREALTFSDWGRIGGLLKRQYGGDGYLERFINDYQTEQGQDWSEAYIANRLGMYAEASSQAFEWAQAIVLGMPPNPMWEGRPLPQFPGDGRTACLSRCRCSWSIHEFDDRYECYWVIDPQAEHCDDCLENQRNWSPLRIAKVSSTEMDILEYTAADNLYRFFGIQESDYTQEEQSLLHRVLQLRDPAPEEAQKDESLWDIFWRVLQEERPGVPKPLMVLQPPDYVQRSQEIALYEEQLGEQG